MSRCAIAAWASRTWAFDSANFLPPFASAGPCGLEPGHGAFADQLPLELGRRREDAEDEAAGRGGGVDLRALAGEHPQAHASGRQDLPPDRQCSNLAGGHGDEPLALRSSTKRSTRIPRRPPARGAPAAERTLPDPRRLPAGPRP